MLCAAIVLTYPLVHAQGAGEAPPSPPPSPTADAASTLSTVTVRAASSDPTTEKSGSYTTNNVSLVKGGQSIRSVPQPVTVMTREYLDERRLLDLNDVLQNTPGVTVDYTDSERVSFHSRGYQIDALQIDGLSMGVGGSIFVQPDTAVLDRVEVLRGASGMLRGSGNPSAAVNLVRKRPTQDFQASAGITLGSWNRRRIDLDLSSPLNEAGTLRGRIVAVADKKDFFQKAREEDRKVLYGVLQADLGPRTTLTASLQHTDLDATGAWGNLPANFDGSSLNLPRDTFLGAAWNRWDRTNQQAFSELEHRFDNDWTLKLSGAYTRLRMKGDAGFKQSYMERPVGATNPYLMNVTTSIYGGDASDQTVLNATANGPFALLGRKHELVVGVETQRVKTTPTVGLGGLNPVTVDIRDWNPYTSYAESFAPVTGTPAVNETRQQGAYATARFSVTDPLTALVGARMSWWDYKVPSRPAGNYSVDREITPYLGLVYDFSNALTAYVSYTEIFTAQSAQDVNGNILAPIRGQDYEAGIKGEFFGGKLNATLSLFRINNVGRAVEDASSINPCLPYFTTGYCRVAGGKTRSQGFELELAGELAPGWQVMGGYTNTQTKYVRDTAANTGQPLRSLDPKHQLRLFTSYKLGGALQGFTVGGGAQINSATYARSGAVTAHQGGFAVYNAMLGYKFDKTYSVQLNVNNLFDKHYYKKYAATGIGNYYGDPRNVMLTLRAAF